MLQIREKIVFAVRMEWVKGLCRGECLAQVTCSCKKIRPQACIERRRNAIRTVAGRYLLNWWRWKKQSSTIWCSSVTFGRQWCEPICCTAHFAQPFSPRGNPSLRPATPHCLHCRKQRQVDDASSGHVWFCFYNYVPPIEASNWEKLFCIFFAGRVQPGSQLERFLISNFRDLCAFCQSVSAASETNKLKASFEAAENFDICLSIQRGRCMTTGKQTYFQACLALAV